MTTNNMKCTWPTPTPRVGDPTQPIFHLLSLGVGFGGNANCRVGVGGNTNVRVCVGSTRLFRYQQVGISNAKFHVGGLSQREDPTQMVLRRSAWNISFIDTSKMMSV